MNEYHYLFTYNTAIGKTKEVRIKDANPAVSDQELSDAIEAIAQANIFSRSKYGELREVKTAQLVTVASVKLI
jgi:hypothetical protein